MQGEYDIRLHSRALGFWRERVIRAESPEAALDQFLAEMDRYGVVRTGPTHARFLDEITVTVAGRLQGQLPLYASGGPLTDRQAGWAGNLDAWDKKRGASRGSR